MLNGINSTVISDFGVATLGCMAYSSVWLQNHGNAFCSSFDIYLALIESSAKKEESSLILLVFFSVMCCNNM